MIKKSAAEKEVVKTTNEANVLLEKMRKQVQAKKLKAAGIEQDVPVSGMAVSGGTDEAIFSWEFKSSRVSAGRSPKYTTLLHKDRKLSCDCPGWVFQRKDESGKLKPRSCKHTIQVDLESITLHAKWKKGIPLPMMEPDVVVTIPVITSHSVSPKPVTDKALDKALSNPNSRIRYGRVIDTD